MYIYRKQLEEADIIVLNKVDLLSPVELAKLRAALLASFPQAPMIAMSAKTGDGVDTWLDAVLADTAAGRTVAEVDYDVYADGEAALGWLNASAELENTAGRNYAAFVMELMESLRRRFSADAAQIAHLKVALQADGDELLANLTNNDEPLSLRGEARSTHQQATLIINARVRCEPAQLRAAVEQCLGAVSGGGMRILGLALESFAPGRPQPTYRDRE